MSWREINDPRLVGTWLPRCLLVLMHACSAQFLNGRIVVRHLPGLGGGGVVGTGGLMEHLKMESTCIE